MSKDQELLVELVSFLAPTNRADVRAMAANHILSLTGGDVLASGPETRSVWENVAVPQLVKWLGDRENVAKPCLDALVNLSAISILYPSSSAISHKREFWRWLIDEVRQTGPLLVNLTSLPKGPEKIEEHILGGSNRACAELLATCSVEKDIRVKEWCLASVRNLTVHDGARKNLADSTPSLRLLVQTTLFGSTAPQRLAAAGAQRNLLLLKDEGVIGRCLALDTGGYLAAALLLGLGEITCPTFKELDESLIDARNERENMSPILTKLFRGELGIRPYSDPDTEHRELLVECLLLIAGTKSGRDKLRAIKVYPAIRAYHPHEKDEKLSEKVFDLVDFLIADEKEPTNETADTHPSIREVEKGKTEDAAWSLD